MNDNRWRRNLLILNASGFTRTFLIIMPIFVPLMQTYGLNMKETMLLQSCFAGVSLLLEIPSGYLADIFGRKRCMTIGGLTAGIGFSMLLWADSFGQLLIFEALLGLSFSLISGSDVALVFESEKALGKKDGQQAIPRLISWINLGEGAAAFTAFALLQFGFEKLIWVQVVVGWVPFVLSPWLTEPLREKASLKDRQNLQQIRQAFMANRKVPALTLLFIATMCITYLVAWLNQSLWLKHDLPVFYFGLIWGFLGITVGLSSRFSAQLPDSFGRIPFMAFLSVLFIVALIALNSRILVLIIAGGLMMSLFRGLFVPKVKIGINNAVDNRFRATVNSITSMGFRLSTLIFGPIIGAIVDINGAESGAQALVVLSIPAIFGLWYAAYRFTKTPVFAGANS